MNLKCVFTVLSVCFSLAVSGQWEGNQEKKFKGCVIDGEISGKYQGKVYLVKEDGMHGDQTAIDSCEVANGKFRFKADTVPAYSVIYFIRSNDGQLAPVFLEEGHIYMQMRADFFLGSRTTGTVNNNLLQLHDAHVRFWTDSMRLASNVEYMRFGRGTSEEEDRKFKARTYRQNTDKLNLEKAMVRDYNDQAFAPFIMLFEMTGELSVDELKELCGQLDEKLRNHPYTLALQEVIINKECRVGGKAPEFSIPGMGGEEIELKNYAGKYVLLDFWASWCAPCRGEMPGLVKLYKECRGKNFEIIGISLDQKEEAWKKAVKELGMTWPQACDFKVWYGKTAMRYNLNAVPFTVLINPDGMIEAMNLRGEELHTAIKNVLKKKK